MHYKGGHAIHCIAGKFGGDRIKLGSLVVCHHNHQIKVRRTILYNNYTYGEPPNLIPTIFLAIW